MSGASVMSHTPRIPLRVLPQDRRRRVDLDTPGTTSVPPIQARTSVIGPNSHSAVASLCQPSSNTKMPRPFCICWNCQW